MLPSIIATLLLFLTATLPGYIAPTDAAAETTEATEQPALTVTLATVQTETWPMQVSAYGEIAPRQEASVSAEIGGQRIVELLADVGDNVKKGQTLAKLNTELLLADKEELNSSLATARSELSRLKRLRATGAASVQEQEEASNRVASARSRLKTTNLKLRYSNIIAPADGVITARPAMLGQTLNAGAELFRMIVDQQLEWRAELTPEQLELVESGHKALISEPNKQSIEGKVRVKGPISNQNTRLTLVYTDLPKGTSLRAGQYVAGKIIYGEAEAITSPAGCIVVRDGKAYVFAVDTRGRAQAMHVRTGRRKGDKIEILFGIKPGAKLVHEGAGFINDGDLVKIAPAATSRRTKSDPHTVSLNTNRIHATRFNFPSLLSETPLVGA